MCPADDDSSSETNALPSILRGREGHLNGHIIRYLAINGPSLIYQVAKYLKENSQTRIHYSTVNRRMRGLSNQNYLQRSGTKNTKAGDLADLYATTLRGDFVACAGLMHQTGKNPEATLSPSQIRQIIKTAARRRGSPFVLIQLILEEGQLGKDLVDTVLIPEISKSVRNGYLNLEATQDSIICSAFASLVARKVMAIISNTDTEPRLLVGSKEGRQYARILLTCLDKTLAADRSALQSRGASHENEKNEEIWLAGNLTPVPIQWLNELRVFLKLSAVRPD